MLRSAPIMSLLAPYDSARIPVVFVHAIEGEAIYRYGPEEIHLKAGDSLSLDAELSHGFKEVLTPEFVFLTVHAERRR